MRWRLIFVGAWGVRFKPPTQFFCRLLLVLIFGAELAISDEKALLVRRTCVLDWRTSAAAIVTLLRHLARAGL